jgi:sarcosine oxidase subunit alpha
MTRARLSTGGLIDRTRPVAFSFDGRTYLGFKGDTLASALLANGVRVMGRSFKYHRPRGVMAAGVEEPNALIGAGGGGRFEPNTRASDLFIYEGLAATSQNRWPSLGLDLGAANQWIGRFIPAGFYYKTFFGGPRLWRVFEYFIRRAAGLGAAPDAPDPDAFEHRAAFCDVLVVGSGPAGLAAAKAAATAGARVLLVEQDDRLGGSLLRDTATIEGVDAIAWAGSVEAAVRRAGGRTLRRTTAWGYWDHGLVTLAERRVEAGQTCVDGGPVQRLWRVRARQVVLAGGAIERPLLFAGNDRPGVMLSTAVRSYVRRFGVTPGRRAVIATATDDAYLTALALEAAGAEVVAILDHRPAGAAELAARLRNPAIVHTDARPVEAIAGSGGVKGLKAHAGGRPLTLACDLICVSGGFTPVAHLHMQAGGGLDWSEPFQAFMPAGGRQGQISAGAAAGADSLTAHLESGWSAGVRAATLEGFAVPAGAAPGGTALEGSGAGAAYAPPAGVDPKSVFVDLQNDVTLADVDLAWREGYRSVEHLKRYTTLGMATDQGKISNLLGLSRLAKAGGTTMREAGLTTFRPPYTPVTLGLLAGEAVGEHAAPQRRGPLHVLHGRRDPVWQPSGLWLRPRAFPRPGETLPQAALREARAVRTRAGLTDVSTLAKFEVVGPDAGALLEAVCATSVSRLAIGRGRYTFMLREDGFVVDDGTVWRLAPEHYVLTSSTGGAARMSAHLSYVRTVLTPHLRVSVVDVQEHWAAAALAGPRARGLLQDLLGQAPPRHMSVMHGRVAGTRVRVLSASYCGERAFELYAVSQEVEPVWTALADAVEADGGALYGLDALELLRIEKGHVEVGAEIDGRRTPADLGLHRMLNPRGGYVGSQGLARPALSAANRETLVGLEADQPIPEGAMLVAASGGVPEGHVSSAGLRLTGQGAVALGLLVNGSARLGETLRAVSPTRGRTATVRVVTPHFHDPGGERYRD